MLFSHLTPIAISDKAYSLSLYCEAMDCFWKMLPTGTHPERPTKVMQLKREFKPENDALGAYSIYHNSKVNKPNVEAVRAKMERNGFTGMYYRSREASLKLHININNIGDVDAEIIFGLIELLKAQSELPDNNISFIFKIIKSEMHSHPRFKMTDQITIYFDKYSSTAGMIGLADIIENYFKLHNIKENELALGPKDSFGFNSFVSARFDNNKLHALYAVYPFFDLELKKFFAKHRYDEALGKLPLCAFEAIFNTLILSPDIIIPMNGSNAGLSEEDSHKISLAFERILRDPHGYLSDVEEQLKEINQQEELRQFFQGAGPSAEMLDNAVALSPEVLDKQPVTVNSTKQDDASVPKSEEIKCSLKFSEWTLCLMKEDLQRYTSQMIFGLTFNMDNRFCYVYPVSDDPFKMPEQYLSKKPRFDVLTEYNMEIDRGLKTDKFRNNMNQKGYCELFGYKGYAPLKLHISINDFDNVPVDTILSLMNFLKKEGEAPDRNISMHFKMITPAIVYSDPRFAMNDQFTIYFDSYSSVGGFLRLAQKINEHLIQAGIKPNEQPRGFKDHFSFNSFVSTRFDSSNLLKSYGEFPFFDFEVEKFFANHSVEELDNFPLFAFEAVFNMIILSPNISIPKKGDGLSEEDSARVQIEFEKVLRDPVDYLKNITQQLKEADQSNDDEKPIEPPKAQILVADEKPIEPPKAQILVAEVKLPVLVENTNKPETKRKKNKIIAPKLNQEAIILLETLLNNLTNKGKQLEQRGDNEKADHIRTLHQDLNKAFSLYKKGASDYVVFENKCKTAIEKALPVLEKHRGLKRILVNLWEAIKSFGCSLFKEHKRTEGKNWFFNIPTSSKELIDEVQKQVAQLKDKPH